MKKDDDMSNTFVAEVGQKSAIFKHDDDEIESLDDNKSAFPDVKIDPPTEMPSVLEDKKEEKTKKVEETEEEDEEFLEAKKKKKSKKYKKRNPFVMFLVILISIALGAGASYYYFEVYTEKDVKEEKVEEPTTKNETTTEEIKPSSRFVNQLIERYDGGYYSIDTYSQLYSKDKVLVSEFDNDYVQRLGVTNIRNVGSFSKEDLQKSLDQLFGTNVYKAQTQDIYFSKCHKYTYANEYYSLEYGNVCGGTALYWMQRKTVKAVKNTENNKLYIDVAVVVSDGSKVYKGYDGTNGTDELTEVVYASFDIEKDYTKLNQYKYTFSYDQENNDYYLESIELIK